MLLPSKRLHIYGVYRHVCYGVQLYTRAEPPTRSHEYDTYLYIDIERIFSKLRGVSTPFTTRIGARDIATELALSRDH